MRTLTRNILTSVMLVLLTTGLATTSNAQFGASSASVRDLVRRIQTDTTTFRSSVQNASNRGNYRVSDLNQLVSNLEAATTDLDQRLGTRRASSNDARTVLNSAVPIDTFLNNNRVNSVIQRNWQTLRSDLDQLAVAYNLNWQWNSSYPTTGSSGLSDFQLRQLVQRIDTRTTAFSRYLRADITSRRFGREQINQQLSSFETAVLQLRNRASSRLISSSDVSNRGPATRPAAIASRSSRSPDQPSD